MIKPFPRKIAIVHDYLREYGGAERVVEAMHELFPEAPVYVAFVDQQALGIHWSRFADWDIHQTWLAKIPGIKRFFSPLRFLAPHAFAALDLHKYDCILSSSNAFFAKAIRTQPGQLHICYCHTPPRSLYGYATTSSWQDHPVSHFFGTLINHYLRVVDVQVAQRVPVFLANSWETQQRIQKFYRRSSTIVFPPVTLPETLSPPPSRGSYFLFVSRLALAKHPELAIQACNQLGVRLKVAGTGKMLPQLREMAGKTVEVLGEVGDAQLAELYKGARALLYPVEDEDFGIVPVEAMGYGLPIIAHRSGGPLETIIENKTGIFFDELTVPALVEAMKQFESHHFDRQEIFQHAQKFSTKRFQNELKEVITQEWTATQHP